MVNNKLSKSTVQCSGQEERQGCQVGSGTCHLLIWLQSDSSSPGQGRSTSEQSKKTVRPKQIWQQVLSKLIFLKSPFLRKRKANINWTSNGQGSTWQRQSSGRVQITAGSSTLESWFSILGGDFISKNQDIFIVEVNNQIVQLCGSQCINMREASRRVCEPLVSDISPPPNVPN